MKLPLQINVSSRSLIDGFDFREVVINMNGKECGWLNFRSKLVIVFFERAGINVMNRGELVEGQ